MHQMSRFLPFDTAPEAQALQDQLYRELGVFERVATIFRLNASVRAMTVAGIRRRHPHYTDDDVKMALARLILGDELVRKVWPDRDLVAP